MQKSLLFVIALGIGIGFLVPTDDRAAPLARETAAPKADAAPTPAAVRETVLERSDGGHFYANVEVNGQLVRFLVDTGATGVALAEKDAARIGIPFSRSEYEVVGMGASGPVQGKRVTLASVRLDGKEARGVSGVILGGGDMSLLGQAYLGRYSVEMRGDRMRIY
ncbi:TIGR02281 family clan AA aspartic protease [Sphingosinicella sp. BN140058]|uniref:retropepsin-like aspartic protease family protein n=1 Tax=Sphingosinicella sp. BN140058 TaxID=1892855 RepID=UPI0010121D2D|nr:TIGR02281 family clan AA aspartic protease [Sphingosinicella sp. BN140058]QAY79039.1 TIGR02281 family clan AA aspartic protease [Sphingosinicella sp. BN140058]